jgi:hypothetical protein
MYNLRSSRKTVGFYNENAKLCSTMKQLKDQLRFEIAVIICKQKNEMIRLNICQKQLNYLIETYGISKRKLEVEEFFNFYQIEQYISDTETRSILPKSITVQLGNRKKLIQRLASGKINILYHCSELVMRFKIKKNITLPEEFYESFGH